MFVLLIPKHNFFIVRFSSKGDATIFADNERSDRKVRDIARGEDDKGETADVRTTLTQPQRAKMSPDSPNSHSGAPRSVTTRS